VIRNAAFLTFILFAASAALAQAVSSTDAAKKLHALFDEDWQWSLEQYPERATLLGDNRYNDRLTDLSPEAIERGKAHEREMLGHIRRSTARSSVLRTRSRTICSCATNSSTLKAGDSLSNTCRSIR